MTGRWAWIEVDPAAIRHNVEWFRRHVAPAAVMAVVKADGYGHGAEVAARAAVAAGASALGVATLAEGIALRRAGLDVPILVLSEQPHGELDRLVAHRLMPTVYRPETVAVLAESARRARSDVAVHVKVDTGMQRVGADPDQALAILADLRATAGVRPAGLFTHFACADEPDRPANAAQHECFERLLASVDDELRSGLTVHAANSAAALTRPTAHYDMVRLGVAMYGISPGAGVDAHTAALRPALAVRARVGFVKDVAAGSSVSYGHRHTFAGTRRVATLPLGYADGVRRQWSGGDVLIGGRRHPIVGVITMDQLMVDLGEPGEADDVGVGTLVTLLGADGDDEITAAEWAERVGTIGYEIVTGLNARLDRRLR